LDYVLIDLIEKYFYSLWL